MCGPTWAVVLAVVLGFIWVAVQSRLKEIDLVQRLPAYRDYMAHVPRFVPRILRHTT